MPHDNRHRSLTRREALSRLTVGASAIALGCRLGDPPTIPTSTGPRLPSRPHSGGGPASVGVSSLFLAGGRDGLLYVPPGLPEDVPAPLLVFFHGASGSADDSYAVLKPYADESGFIALMPSSRGYTWDMIRTTYGPDVEYVDLALRSTYNRCNIDPDHVSIAGFSDGASYALSIGRANGDFVHRIVAFSPGVLDDIGGIGKPPIYFTHGSRDTVLPFAYTSEMFVEELSADGYEVTLQIFNGGHAIPGAIAHDVLRWAVTDEDPPLPPES